MSVANIRKLQENFAAVQDGCEISQHEGHHFAAKGWFRSPRNWPSAWCDQLPMALTPSFQLRIMHRLKCGLMTSRASKRHIVCINWALGSAPKVAESGCPLECFMVDFSFAFPPCIPDLLKAKDYKASKLWFFMFLSFPLLFHGFQRTFLNLGLLWWSNY